MPRAGQPERPARQRLRIVLSLRLDELESHRPLWAKKAAAFRKKSRSIIVVSARAGAAPIPRVPRWSAGPWGVAFCVDLQPIAASATGEVANALKDVIGFAQALPAKVAALAGAASGSVVAAAPRLSTTPVDVAAAKDTTLSLVNAPRSQGDLVTIRARVLEGTRDQQHVIPGGETLRYLRVSAWPVLRKQVAPCSGYDPPLVARGRSVVRRCAPGRHRGAPRCQRDAGLGSRFWPAPDRRVGEVLLTRARPRINESVTWFLRKVLHLWPSPGTLSGQIALDVRLETRIPILRSSPRIRSAPQRGLRVAISRMRPACRLGLRPLGRERQRQKRRKPAWCHRSTVADWTWATAVRHAVCAGRQAPDHSSLRVEKRTRLAWRRHFAAISC
jgi:hypothetical protein